MTQQIKTQCAACVTRAWTRIAADIEIIDTIDRRGTNEAPRARSVLMEVRSSGGGSHRRSSQFRPLLAIRSIYISGILGGSRILHPHRAAISDDFLFFPARNFLYCFTRVRYLRDGNSPDVGSQTLHFARTNKLLITVSVCRYCLCIAAPRVYPRAFAPLR